MFRKIFYFLIFAISVSSCRKKEEDNSPTNYGPCTNFASPYASNDGPVEVNGTLHLVASTSELNVVFSWTGPDGFTSSVQNPVINGITFDRNGSYCVTIANGTCTSSGSSTNVIVKAPCGTISANTAVVGTQTWNFYTAVTCGNIGASSHYQVRASAAAGELNVNFNKLDVPSGFKIYPVDSTDNPAFDSTKVQMVLTELGDTYRASGGNVYVGNGGGTLSITFCGVLFINTSNGTSKAVKAKITCP